MLKAVSVFTLYIIKNRTIKKKRLKVQTVGSANTCIFLCGHTYFSAYEEHTFEALAGGGGGGTKYPISL